MSAGKGDSEANGAPSVTAVFSDRLREARLARVWTQERLAQEMGAVGAPIDRATIARIEGRRKMPSLEQAVALAVALDVALVHLLVPIEDDGEVALTCEVKLDVPSARAWARGRPEGHAARPENERFYQYQSPPIVYDDRPVGGPIIRQETEGDNV